MQETQKMIGQTWKVSQGKSGGANLPGLSNASTKYSYRLKPTANAEVTYTAFTHCCPGESHHL